MCRVFNGLWRLNVFWAKGGSTAVPMVRGRLNQICVTLHIPVTKKTKR
jgi:hypothetical protein